MGGPTSAARWLTIVGTAAPTRYRELTSQRPTIYLPSHQFQMTAQLLVLHTTASLDQVGALARDQ